jgi:hypothetical protein
MPLSNNHMRRSRESGTASFRPVERKRSVPWANVREWVLSCAILAPRFRSLGSRVADLRLGMGTAAGIGIVLRAVQICSETP